MYSVFKLENGLRVVVENIDYMKSVSIGLWIENGSRNETTLNNGISHFIEHMLFKGTERRTAKQIAESIEEVGGQINAFTGKESTCFYIKVLDSHLELSLDILSDMLFNSKFDEEEIEKEKSVIIEEINMSEDMPEDVLGDLHSKAVWGDDSISMPILGSISTVKSFARMQLIDYLNSYYIPDNSVISICGKVDIKEIPKLIESYFGQWKTYNKKITEYSTPITFKNHLVKKKDIEQLHINLGMKGIEAGNDEVYSLLVLNNMFGGGAASLLFQRIREEKGLCYSIYSYLTSYNNTGILSIYAGLNPKYAAEVVKLIKEELYKFANTDITEEKIVKMKEQLKGNFILGLESTSSRMFSNGKSYLFFNKINSPDDVLKKIDKINKDSVRNALEKTFSQGIVNSAFVGPDMDINSMINIIEGDINAFKNKKSKRI